MKVWIAKTGIPGLFDVWVLRPGEAHEQPDRMPDYLEFTLGQIDSMAVSDGWTTPSGASLVRPGGPMLRI